ncbi:acetyl/propionyl-CoA carboxylase subuit alpha [Rhodococcus sp. WMMA185]|uniref:acetyl/propionyl/methylcrotonyl-CoA carboxylase subunit alpha n=1 Tax=Rhodococcus sp. WMMA185 TaxID=679318 RepID=UPI00087867CF|nr:biotin carboxylase N-terminal domain-containing protein [Rhodococcus sp. WMMA185]AOW94880.1 acetyl/propionyl-CoA carboxylase subuit alpha [Rhodococcus sp. WMMA185]
MTTPTAPLVPGTITSVLVANRGEIARRIFATCRRAGIGTVAVYSDPDAQSPHAAEADIAVRLPGSSPADTYLRGDLVIEAALRAGADAIHPGYGFLSENAGFASAVIEAGLTWIGPPPPAIEMMGSKVESKKMMATAGVPVLAELDPDSVTEADLPVLVKASAGGGGRGMRVVRALEDLPEQLEAARREAQSAFGDPTVFCERYLETGRHIEVQVMADRHGAVWAVGERECSIQRRHQKVVEEAPSPLVDARPGMRDRLFEAARLAAKAIDYEGAGTVEFLASGRAERGGDDADAGDFYFLEMNTRLQVEHPVTECTTGLDLVELQLQVATGHALGAESTTVSGHSIEVRLYAEDPTQNWQPQSGPVYRIEMAEPAVEFDVLRSPGIRLDSGVVDGSTVGVHYDPMLAKVISFAPTRTQAATRLAAALSRAKIHGLRTNRDLLVNVLRHPAFLAGDTDTAFFDTHSLDVLSRPLASTETERLSALAAALADAAHNRDVASVNTSVPSGWRNLASAPQSKTFSGRGGDIEIRYLLTRSGLRADEFENVTLVSAASRHVALEVDGLRRTFDVARYGDDVFVDSALGPVSLHATPRFTDPSEVVAEGSLLAPMPGSVIRLGAAVGDTVVAGQPIVWLEAMKMEHTIKAPNAGVISDLSVTAGQQVDVGTVLAVVEASTAEHEGES